MNRLLTFIIAASLLMGLVLGVLLWSNYLLPPPPSIPDNAKLWRLDDHLLSWEDFQGSIEGSAIAETVATATATGTPLAIPNWLGWTTDSNRAWQAILIFRTVAYFDRNSSYVNFDLLESDPEDVRQLTLVHEQGHFDLAEAGRRQLQREFPKLKGYGKTSREAIEDLLVQLENLMRKMTSRLDQENQLYDHDVNALLSPGDLLVQQAWLKRIQDELNNRSGPLDPAKIQIEGQAITGQPLAASARAHLIFVDGKGQKIEGEANPDGSFIIQIPPEFDPTYPIRGHQEIWFEGTLVAQPAQAITLTQPQLK